MRFEVAELSGAMTVVDVDIQQVVIGGWTGRDAAAVQHHIDELAEIGVPGPSEAPLFYRVGHDLLTQSSVIQTVGAGGSGGGAGPPAAATGQEMTCRHEAAPELVFHSWTPLWARGPGSCLGFASARMARVIRHLIGSPLY